MQLNSFFNQWPKRNGITLLVAGEKRQSRSGNEPQKASLWFSLRVQISLLPIFCESLSLIYNRRFPPRLLHNNGSTATDRYHRFALECDERRLCVGNSNPKRFADQTVRQIRQIRCCPSTECFKRNFFRESALTVWDRFAIHSETLKLNYESNHSNIYGYV